MGTPQRVRVYARISKDREGEALGVSRQIEDCTRLATERLGWTLHPDAVVVDNDISASTKSRKARPGFEGLIASVESGDCDGIVYYSTSRLTRRPAEYERVVELVERTGVRLATVVSGAVDLSTSQGRMIGRILGNVDAAEAEQIGERVQRAMQQRRESGKTHAVGKAFGFARGGVVVEPCEAEAIRLGAQMILDGKSLRDVGRAWQEAGHEPPAGAQLWAATTVRRILTSPRVAGLVAHKGAVVGPSLSEAILDVEIYAAVQAKLGARAAQYKKGSWTGTEVHLLAGFVFCGKCGHRMGVNALRDEDGNIKKSSHVSCKKETGGCGGTKRNLVGLTEFVTHWLQVYLSTLPDGRVVPQVETDRAALEAERDRLKDAIAILRADLRSGALPAGEFTAAVGGLNEDLAAVTATLTTATPASSIVVDAFDLIAEWYLGDLAVRRQILAVFVKRIVLLPVGRVGPTRAKAMMSETVKFEPSDALAKAWGRELSPPAK